MKKFFIVAFVFLVCACAWCAKSATPITIPGSQFPVVTVPSNDMRFLMIYTNGGLSSNPLLASNASITYSDLKAGFLTSDLLSLPSYTSPASTFNFLFEDSMTGHTNGTISYPNLLSAISSSVGGVFINVQSAGLLGGTNDDTAALQAILNNPANVNLYFPPTNYTIGQIYITNAVHMLGYGSVINFPTNLTSATMLNFASNDFNTFTIEGMSFNGGNTNDTYTTFRGTNTLRCCARPWVNSKTTFLNDHFNGFDIGMYMMPNQNDGFIVQALPRTVVAFSEFSTNGVGIVNSTLDATHVAEYMLYSTLTLHDNSLGLYVEAGNINVIGNQISHNYDGIIVEGTLNLNAGHGIISDNNFNHMSDSAIICTNLSVGEFIFGNVILAGNANVDIYNCKRTTVMNNFFDVGSIIRLRSIGSFSGPNYAIGNRAPGPFGTISGLQVYDDAAGGVEASTTNIVSIQNGSETDLGFDDPSAWNAFQTNLIAPAFATAGVTNAMVVLPGGTITKKDITALGGANFPSGTLPYTAADTTWPPASNYVHVVGTNAGNILWATGTNDSFGSPIYTNGPVTTSQNGTGLTNYVSWTHEGLTTNITATFNGSLQSFTVTNGPTVFIHYAGANGSCSYRFTTNVTLVFDYQPKWLSGSNNAITNGVLSLTSYGGTNTSPHNQIEAAIGENQ